MEREKSPVYCPLPPAPASPPEREAKKIRNWEQAIPTSQIPEPPASEDHNLMAPRKELSEYNQMTSQDQNVAENCQLPYSFLKGRPGAEDTHTHTKLHTTVHF